MEISIKRTISGSRTFSSPLQLVPLLMTFTLFLTVILPAFHCTVRGNLPPSQHQSVQQSPGAEITAGFLQLHPNGFPGDGRDDEEEDGDGAGVDYSSAVLLGVSWIGFT